MKDIEALNKACDNFLNAENFSSSYISPIIFGKHHMFQNKLQEDVEQKGVEQLREDIKDPKLFKKYIKKGWVDEYGDIIHLRYRYNKFGYRRCTADEVVHKENSILTLGCSDTFGAGNFEDKVWPYLVSKSLNKPVLNGGIPGGSLSEAYKVLAYELPNMKIDTVMLLIPERARELYYYWSEDYNYVRKTTLTPAILNVYDKDPDSIDIRRKELIENYRNYFLTEESMALSFKRNINAIQYLCESNNINLIFMPNPNYYGYEYEEYCSLTLGKKFKMKKNYSKSRDYLHYDEEFHKDIASYFIQRYRQINKSISNPSPELLK